jgi:hypothetical protein
MNTTVKEFSSEILESKIKGVQYQVLQRSTSPMKWFDNTLLKERFSGTLIKAQRHGLRVGEHAKHEAIAQTMGYLFEILPASRVTFGDALSEGDCHSITETLWHCDRLIANHIFPEDVFEVAWITVSEDSGERVGIGLVVKETSIQWIGSSNLLFAIVAIYDTVNHKWEAPVNPF